MKKIKNKLFYINSFLLYMFLAIVAFVLSFVYLEPNVKSFFISTFMANKVGSENILEIIIDDANPEYWPWTKAMYTDLLDYFSTYAKPKVVGLDVFLPSINPNMDSDKAFLNKISKMDNLVVTFLPNTTSGEEDKQFLSNFQNKQSLSVNKEALMWHTQYHNITKVDPEYYSVAKNFGFVKVNPDSVGNRLFAGINVIKIGDAYYPSLAFKMYLLANKTNELILNDFNVFVPSTGLKIPNKLNLDGLIQTDIRYYANRLVEQNGKLVDTHSSHYSIHAADILNSYKHLKSGKLEKNDISPDIFKDTVVFIGVNISGPADDVFRTPIQERHAGVDVQATMYDNIANNYFMHSAGFLPQLLNILLLSLITFILILRCKFIKSLLLVSLMDFIFFALVGIGAYNGYLMSFINPIVVQFVTLIFGYSFKFISESRNKEKIKQAMGKYLSNDIMKNVVSNIDDLKLGGKRAIVTVLFSDIRGFTSLSEKMSAEEVSMILNEYFSEMEPIITKYNGVINKFIGDAVMAIFGEPIQDINHPQNAVKCAYEMLKKVEYLREKWLYEGKPKIEIGVGINTGEVFIGNIGTENRMEYTVIGDTVNLASRIESYNKVYKTNLLVSSSTYASIADIADVIKISEVQIRGKAKKMNIYEVLRIDMKKGN